MIVSIPTAKSSPQQPDPPNQMRSTSKNLARLLALLAICSGGVVFLLILSSGLGGGSSEPDADNSTIEQTRASGRNRPPARYVVQNGDTLIEISEKTGVSVDRLRRLNPGIDPQILVSGQTLRLRRPR